MITTKDAIKIKTMSRKHLDQVQMVLIAWSAYRPILQAIAKGDIVPRFWLSSSAVGRGDSTSFPRYWLVEGPEIGNFRLFIPPDRTVDETTDPDTKKVIEIGQSLTQLFVD